MQMTSEQILHVNGWKIKDVRFYSCGFCHRTVSGIGWVSPKFKSYHLGCVIEAPQVKRLLTKHATDGGNAAPEFSNFE